jgi:hypothetical protein
MNSVLTGVVATSLVLLFLILARSAWDSHKWGAFASESVLLLAFVVFFHRLFGFPFPQTEVVAKGPQTGQLLAVALYVSMLLGMFAEFLYSHFEKPKRKRTQFDWGLFFAPVCASPIVFIPLMAAFQSADVDLQKSAIPRLMVFLVAFQNGFFWKEHFDARRKDV